MKSKRSKATDIPQKVKQHVWERDGGACVICGSMINVMPNAHFIRRSQGGLGIEQNVFTACTRLSQNDCHYRFDNDALFREKQSAKLREYFKRNYPNWNERNLVYRKYGF